MEVSHLTLKFDADGAERTRSEIRGVSNELDAVSTHAEHAGSRLGSVFKIAGGILGGAAVYGIFQAAKGVLMLDANAQQAHNSLETVTGSVEKANALFDSVQKFAASTPFEFPELVQSTINMEAFGLNSQKWLPVIGDTASAMGKSIDQVTQAVLDASTGEYERLKELGITTRTEGDKLVLSYMDNGKMITQTVDKNNKEIVADTIYGIWNKKYEGAMKKQSKSFIGQFSTLHDNISMKLQQMSQGVFKFVTKGLAFFNDIFALGFVDAVRNHFGRGVGDLLGHLGRMGGAFIAAFQSGTKVSDLVKRFPAPLQGLAKGALLVADAFGDLIARWRSSGFVAMLKDIPGEFSQAWEGIKQAIRGAFSAIGDALSGLGSAIVAAVSAIDWSAVGSVFVAGLNRAWEFVRAHPDDTIAYILAGVVGIAVLEAIKAIHWESVATAAFQGIKQAFAAVPWGDIWSGITTFFTGLWTAFQNFDYHRLGFVVGAGIRAAIIAIGPTIISVGGEIITSLYTGLTQNWQTILKWFALWPFLIPAAIVGAAVVLIPKAAEFLGGFLEGLGVNWDGQVKPWLMSLPAMAIVAIGDVTTTLVQQGMDLINGLWDGAFAAWDSFTNWLADIPNKIVDWVGDLSGILYGAGLDAIQGLINGAEDAIPGLEAVVARAIAIWNQIPLLGNSPWPMMIAAGKDAMDGLIIGGHSRMGALDTMVGRAMSSFGASPGFGSPTIGGGYGVMPTPMTPPLGHWHLAGAGSVGPRSVRGDTIIFQPHIHIAGNTYSVDDLAVQLAPALNQGLTETLREVRRARGVA